MVGSKIFPPMRCLCSGTAGSNFIQLFEYARTAFYAGCATMVPFGTHTFATYTNPYATDATGLFVIAQDFENFTGKAVI